MLRKSISLIVASTFIFSLVTPIPLAQAHSLLGLPEPGTMVDLSTAYEPALIKGISIHRDNPFLFDFIVDTGRSRLEGDELKKEGDRLIKYFFAALTIPDKDVWVNLSPYEKDRIIPPALGQTALGRDLLAQDYLLKQLTASLIYPEKALGRNFWDKVYAQAREKFGTTDIPVNTFNKVWIVADKASVWEHQQSAFIVSSHLKVMLEEDYLAMQKHQSQLPQESTPHTLASQIIRQIVLPALEQEINTGKNFATLRQVFYAQILAVWFKRDLKQALLSQVYADHSTVNGINLKDPSIMEQIYQRYLEAYRKGAFNYIKEENDPLTQQPIPRKYYSGGYDSTQLVIAPASDMAMRSSGPATGKDVLFTVALGLNQGGNKTFDAAMWVKSSASNSVSRPADLPAGVFTNGGFNMEMGRIKNNPAIYSDLSQDKKSVFLNGFLRRMTKSQRMAVQSWSPPTEFTRDLIARMQGDRAMIPEPIRREMLLKGESGGWENNMGQFMRRILGAGGSVGTYPRDDGGFSKVIWNNPGTYKAVTVIYYPDSGDWIIKETYDGITFQELRWNRREGVLNDWANKVTLHLGKDPFIDLTITGVLVNITLSQIVIDSGFSRTFSHGSSSLRIKAPAEQDPAMGSRQQEDWNKGGIDLGTLNDGLSVSRDANGGVVFAVDPAVVQRVRQEGITAATPVIIDMKMIASVDDFLRV